MRRLLLAALILCGGAQPGAGAQEEGAPVKPFGRTGKRRPERRAAVELSNRSPLRDPVVRARADLKLTVFVPAKKKHVEVDFAEIVRLQQTVLKQGMEKEWRWKEGGGNEKIYTGKAYPWRQYNIEITTVAGETLKGRLARGFPLKISWVTAALGQDLGNIVSGKTTAWDLTQQPLHGGQELNQRDLERLRRKVRALREKSRKSETFLIQPKAKGKPGQTMHQLTYVKSIYFRAAKGKKTKAKRHTAEPRKPLKP